MSSLPNGVSLQKLQSSTDHLVLVTLGGIVQSRVAQCSLHEEFTNDLKQGIEKLTWQIFSSFCVCQAAMSISIIF